ncbi:MAG: hypothetical protein IPQ00_07155 [Chloracidobacterium sp.]|nr:hypothetical protein [Chloracidobacterium sp.]
MRRSKAAKSGHQQQQQQPDEFSQDYTYDAAGNTPTDANGQIFVYDGENKQVKASTSSGTGLESTFYDGDNKRVKRVRFRAQEKPRSSSTTPPESKSQNTDDRRRCFNGKGSTYLTPTTWINTDVTGAVASRHDYHPFGEEIATSQRTSVLGYADDTIRKQFTGYEIDGETDLDFCDGYGCMRTGLEGLVRLTLKMLVP